jgi:cyclophilin family peptidyl-prolyl cis-trans isomerase
MKNRILIIVGIMVVLLLVITGYFLVKKNMDQAKNNQATNSNIKNFKPFEIKYTEEQIASIKTNLGEIIVKLYSEKAPFAVNNFLTLAEINFYNQTKFHRVIEGFMIQGGNPYTRGENQDMYGTGGPGYTFPDEIDSSLKLVRGSLAMANSGPDTNGSQFFIVTAESTPWLDGQYTIFGEVIEGMDVVDKIEALETNERDYPTEEVIVESVDLIEMM